MRILLTGGHGMVGRNILAHARARQHEFLAPSRAVLDLRDAAAVQEWFRTHRPDMVVHAAGKVGGIRANMLDPFGYLIENLEIGTNVVSVARATGVKRMLNLGSSCIYPRDVDGFLTEDLILTGKLEPTNEGYALAKLAALKLCEFASTDDRAYKTILPCNLYGPYDNFDLQSAHLIPAIIRKTHEAKCRGDQTIEIWGDGSARREFMYAGDLADAVHEFIDRFDDAPSLMNIGLGEDHTVLQYYMLVARVLGWKGEFTFDVTKPAGMRRKVVDVSRQKKWGWLPSTSLEDGIRKTYESFLGREVR